MNLRPRFLIGAGLFLLLGLITIYLAGRLQPYQETIEHGPSPEVRGNPYLAAEHFLRKQGLQVTRADGLEVLNNLPSAGNTLLLLGSRARMTPTLGVEHPTLPRRHGPRDLDEARRRRRRLGQARQPRRVAHRHLGPQMREFEGELPGGDADAGVRGIRSQHACAVERVAACGGLVLQRHQVVPDGLERLGARTEAHELRMLRVAARAAHQIETAPNLSMGFRPGRRLPRVRRSCLGHRCARRTVPITTSVCRTYT